MKIGAEGEAFSRIMRFLNDTNFESGKNVYFTLDPTDYEFRQNVTLETPKLKNFKTYDASEDERRAKKGSYFVEFKADSSTVSDIMRLILAIKEIGDGGHGFDIKVEYDGNKSKQFYWDGDGEDFICSLNHLKAYQRKSWKSDMAKIINDEKNSRTDEVRKYVKQLVTECLQERFKNNKFNF